MKYQGIEARHETERILLAAGWQQVGKGLWVRPPMLQKQHRGFARPIFWANAAIEIGCDPAQIISAEVKSRHGKAQGSRGRQA